jgi:hypothetical protein
MLGMKAYREAWVSVESDRLWHFVAQVRRGGPGGGND